MLPLAFVAFLCIIMVSGEDTTEQPTAIAETTSESPRTTAAPSAGPAPPPNITITIGPVITIANVTKLQLEIAAVVQTALPSRVRLTVTPTTDGTVCLFFFQETQFSAGTPLSSMWLSFRFQNGYRNREELFMRHLGYIVDSGATFDFGTLPQDQPATPVPPTTRNPKLPPQFFNPAPFGGKVAEVNETFGADASEGSTSTTTGVIVGVVVGCVVIGGGVGVIKWYTNKQQNAKGGSKYVPGQV
jgi:hypothetical protein